MILRRIVMTLGTLVVAATLLGGAAARADQCVGNPRTLSYGNPPRKRLATMNAPMCGGTGTVLSDYRDNNGELRYACLSQPLNMAAGVQLPLVVYLHPSLFTPDTLYGATDLPEFIQTADLTGDPNRPGFILLAPQGRNTTHFYPFPDDTGPGWDNWYRNTQAGLEFGLPEAQAENVDVAAIDHYIEEIIAQGHVDTSRIFLTGWSNGSAMAILYGHARATSARVRGWAIAAIGIYSAPNPYDDFNDPCPVADFSSAPAPKISKLPAISILHIHNDCDIVGICESGQNMARVFYANGVSVSDDLLNSALEPSAACLAQCDRTPSSGGNQPGVGPDGTLGTANHSRWPHNWTPALLHFFQLHPLRGRR